MSYIELTHFLLSPTPEEQKAFDAFKKIIVELEKEGVSRETIARAAEAISAATYLFRGEKDD